jgi:iron complex transport system substrate-binding protein
MPTASSFPSRIVCLTEETTEALYLLGEDWRIVGISGFTVRPPRARKEKPRVSAFTSAKLERIVALEPDLVLGFSDLQADIAAELVRRGIEVHVFNQRSVAGILGMLRTLGGMIGCEAKTATLVGELAAGLDSLRTAAAALPRRPRVYFEEWDAPQISAIGWVSELIGIAGGEDIFPELATQSLGRDRIIADPLEVPQEIQPAVGRGASRLAGRAGRARRRAARGEVVDHPAAGSRRAHRRRARAAPRDRRVGPQAGKIGEYRLLTR